MTKLKLKKLIQHLRGLGNGTIRPRNIRLGLCCELDILKDQLLADSPRSISSHYYGIVKRFAYRWPLYSGNEGYPVPHPDIVPDFAYSRVEDLWGNDEYGDNRRSLCLFLADSLEHDGLRDD